MSRPVRLTGREPLLRTLRARLGRRGADFGRVLLSGPRGAGHSRLLDEVERLLREAGRPPPLRVRPVPDASPPLEALRRAVFARLERASPEACRRAVTGALGRHRAEGEALARWIQDGPACGVPPPAPATLAHLLAALAPGCPVLVDDLDRLDALSRETLAPGSDRPGVGVLAGCSGPVPPCSEADVLEVPALSRRQVELLLARWLHRPATVRRLAPALAAAYDGRPGCIVRAVRALAAAGDLEGTAAGVRAGLLPDAWPAPASLAPDFAAWARALSPPSRRVLVVAALLEDAGDVALLAAAAGVKRGVVRALREEAEATFPVLGEDLFPDAAARRAFLGDAGETERRRAASDLGAAVLRVNGGAASLRTAVAHLRGLHLAQRPEALAGAVERVLDHLPPRWRPAASLRSFLAEAARPLGTPGTDASERALLRLVDALADAGGEEEARRLLAGCVADGPEPGRRWVRRLRLGLEAAPSAHALEGRLSGADGALGEAERFRAWMALAEDLLARDEVEEARRAWARAASAWPRPPGLLRARWHEGLAAAASRRGRPRGRAAHLARAAALHGGLGRRDEEGRLWLESGRSEEALGRLHRARRSLHASVRALRRILAPRALVEALHESAHLALRLNAYEEAAEACHEALDVCRRHGDAGGLVPALHLGLALACAGRGDASGLGRHARLAGVSDMRLRWQETTRLLLRHAAGTASAGCHGLDALASSARAVPFPPSTLPRAAQSAPARPRPPDEEPRRRLHRARLCFLAGDDREGCAALEAMAVDARVPTSLRVEAYARLAHACLRAGRREEARRAAHAGAGLLQVQRRCRAEDGDLHHLLSLTYRALGDPGRHVLHRRAARRGSSRRRAALTAWR